MIDLASLNYGGVVKNFLDDREIYGHAVLYENLCENPRREIETLFDIMNIDHSHIETALEAFDFDSQNKTFGPRGVEKEEAYPRELWERLDEVYAALNIPIRHDMTLEQFKKVIMIKPNNQTKISNA